MSVAQIKALTRMGRGPRSLGWIDDRPRSPKALGDMSGVILSRVGTSGIPAVQEFDYEALSKIYICNDMVWTCINLVSSTAALARLKVRKRTGDQIEYLPDHPLQQLLDFPNASMTHFDLIQSYVTHQLLFGSVTMLLMREGMLNVCPICAKSGVTDCAHKLFYDTTTPIVQIMPVYPSNIRQKYIPYEGAKKMFFFYCPNGTNGTEYIIHPDNMLTDPFYNPDIGWYGVSPTHLLCRWLDLDESMTKQVNDFFDNGAIPSMIISMKPGANFTYEQEPDTLMEMMKAKWMERFSAGGKSAKAPAFVFGDVTVDKVSDRVDEAIAKNIYYEIENRVCATYGVPPTLYEMGLKYGGQRASAEQGEKDFYNRTISKILIRLKNKLSQLVLTSFKDEGIELDWDLSDMGIATFLIEKKEAKIERHWEKGLVNRDETRQMLGYKPIGGEFGDDFYRLTVMSDGSNTAQAAGMDNRLKTPQLPSKTDKPVK